MSVTLDAKLNSSPEYHQKHSFTSKVKSRTKAAIPCFRVFFIGYSFLKETKVISEGDPTFPLLSFFSVLSVPSSIKEILIQAKKKGLKGAEAMERNLKIASATANVACGILHGIKIADAFGIAICNIASHSMGPVRVAVTTLAPFTVVLAGIEIVKTSIDIGIDAVHIHQTNKKIKELKNKRKLWGSVDWKNKEVTPIVSNKIEYLEAKQISSKLELSSLEGALKTSGLALNHRALKWDAKKEKLEAKKLALSQRNVIIRLFGKIVPSMKAAQSKSKYKVTLKAHTEKINEFSHLSDKYSRRTVKIKNWKVVETKMKSGTISDKDEVLLKKFQNDQIAKWSTKRSNYNLEKFKIGLGIALKTVVIITLIASIALTFSGYGTLPAFITLATLSLFIIAAEYGLKKFKKHKKPAKWEPGQVPLLTQLT